MNQVSKILRFLSSSYAGPLVALVFITFAFTLADWAWGTGNFLSVQNMRSNSNTAALIAIPALGMTVIIIAGGIDLSAGTALTLCGTVMAVMLKSLPVTNEEPWFASSVLAVVIGTVLVGVLCGLVNGALISLTKVVPFIVTLGTMSVFLGLGQIVSGESTVTAPSQNCPAWLQSLCYTGPVSEKYYLIAGLPSSVILTAVLTLLLAGMLRYTVFGRNVFALGSSESTARLCGINVPWTILGAYGLAGLFVAIGGITVLADVGRTINPTEGQGKELEIIAAVVLGGGSLSGGRGSVLGTVFGAMIIVVIRNGCGMLSIPNTYTHIVIGCIIITAVIIDQLRQRSLRSA